jgi:hypothetical protein
MRGNSNPTSSLDKTDDSDIGNDISQLDMQRSTRIAETRSSADGSQLAAEEFGRIHGEEMKQVQVVQVLKERVAVFKRKVGCYSSCREWFDSFNKTLYREKS